MSQKNLYLGWLGALLLLLTSCVPSPPPPQQGLAADQMNTSASEAEKILLPPGAKGAAALASDPLQLPVRFQRPNYAIQEPEGAQVLGQEEEVRVQVGADISSTTGPVPLRDIVKRLAALKSMNVSWASDVDQYLQVDVDIRAEDDFFESLENLLRQVDYFHEVQGNTIVVKYKATQRFQVAMPFLNSVYETGVGGDVLGGAKKLEDDFLKGNIKLYSSNNKFNIWDNIRKNLDGILEIWAEPTPQAPSAAAGSDTDKKEGEAAAEPAANRPARSGKGYYSIDEPIGLITVTAPKVVLEKVASYLENLKKQIYRQVSIEAKILEVTLVDSSTKGIDWTKLISGVGVDFQLFGPNGIIYSADPTAQLGRVIQEISTPDNPFKAVVAAIEEQGRTKILANPRISVMNGQPALISVGENVAFIDSIESNVSESGVITYTVNTSSILSGLGLSVVATIMEDDGIILSLTPVTSQLTKLDSVDVGMGSVMLPTVRLREMTTLVRIQDGGMLVVGGLIDENDRTDDTKVPLLGNLPVINRLFKSEVKNKTKTELVILLRPQII